MALNPWHPAAQGGGAGRGQGAPQGGGQQPAGGAGGGRGVAVVVHHIMPTYVVGQHVWYRTFPGGAVLYGAIETAKSSSSMRPGENGITYQINQIDFHSRELQGRRRVSQDLIVGLAPN